MMSSLLFGVVVAMSGVDDDMMSYCALDGYDFDFYEQR